ncbi:DUF317 domain-containing protein [Streptomyces sp. NBC_01102]|nr:DUF317 domain-containing protein [Streptomyces sp. NBC_01102]
MADLHTIWPFPFDDGWHLHPADEGLVFASSPCARLWTRFAPAPERQGKGTWTIGANRVPFGTRAWEISFDATTPAEVLHDVHAELLDLYLEGRSSAPDRRKFTVFTRRRLDQTDGGRLTAHRGSGDRATWRSP